ncbi:MAG: ATP-binding protein [Gammaproteobacteria bacterium]|nr:ATP-binding protein [Gammaproteobacteria bacterium]
MQVSVKSIGQITQGAIEFGDLTVLVGPQSSGKSIFLQLLKLIHDSNAVVSTLKEYGFEWGDDLSGFLLSYFGEGMGGLLSSRSEIHFNHQAVNIEAEIADGGKTKERLFLIPAQRVMMLQTGWPRPFSDYGIDTPFVTRLFSESVRKLLDRGLGGGEAGVIFPSKSRFENELTEILNESVFRGSRVVLDKGLQKRIMLELPDGNRLPFMTWSTGQREFTPLLLGFYLLTPIAERNKKIEWVVIEEPEMGLHPKAISAVMLFIIELLRLDYKVIISTHSPHVLDVVWAIQEIRRNQASPKLLLEIFDASPNDVLTRAAEKLINKKTSTYYFAAGKDGVRIQDISNLEPGSQNRDIAGWGGLTAFSGKVAGVVAKAARQNLQFGRK